MVISRIKPFGYLIKDLHFSFLDDSFVVRLESLLKESGLVVIDNIKLTALQLKSFCERFSPLESTDPYLSEDGVDGVLRVTSETDRNGKPLGIFGHTSPLGWHANKPSNRLRKSIVCTYSITGCDGSETWWSSTDMAFADMDHADKNFLRNISGYFGYKENVYTEEKYKPHMIETPWPLVFERYRREVFYFPFNQIIKFTSHEGDVDERLLIKFKNTVTNDKYIYKHVWNGTQIVLSDQWTTIHCRPRCKMEGRKLLRTTFNYSTDVFPF